MITIYTTNSCTSCKKAKQWLKNHNIEFIEKNIFISPVTPDDIKRMLEHTENGFEDIISTRSKIISQGNIDIENMKFNELVDFIIKNPSILRRPIIVEDSKMQVGYNDEEIRVFIPRELRKQLYCTGCKDECDYTKKLGESLSNLE